ncbi:hypothetical protein WJ0W_000897 [Paenibacillus melissococcoides]|uniref:HTH cro/C1-type domain-containing protein n=1 Tax=Paenibacillus melissococcoides TaxID=2912268 RepID=A0ABN8TYA0_9BACL|nr:MULTISPECIES: helix-turn-helix domain-containing protein [Paenibacillus]MEB9892569.1 hypothetical protein [Bacillus cereus]CAH8243657.1 hypothetical protein WJ0W_000897 [Paenibacillus melissococcoides]CAH8704979.1 hypothetical protein HTL2_000753 [Paenibacillus melissococcoides]CAH8707751.1 hypothetical protein WDD9_001716 [Paenibacillus melissococcoides]GIO77461.1 hypothetical protein J6TS7_10710 [Paenibacillus dendritiformis]
MAMEKKDVCLEKRKKLLEEKRAKQKELELLHNIFHDEIRYVNSDIADALLEMEEKKREFNLMYSINKLNFKDIRENCQLTIDEVAAATGLHRRTIEKAEEDCGNVHVGVLMLLCDHYDISPNHISLGKG